jgi:hypothetical protein
MQITIFEIAQQRTSINLRIEGASSLTSLKFWNEKTYKNNSTAIDFTSKLTGAAVENIVISLIDLDIPYFDGVYFIEATSPQEADSSIVSDLTRYKECILTKIVDLAATSECLNTKDSTLTNAHTLLLSLEIAIEENYIDEILLIAKVLNRFCSNTCKACGEYDAIIDPTYYSS